MRELTSQERQQIANKRKPENERPRYFNAGSQKYERISYDFETFILLISIGFRASIGQYLAALGATTIGGGSLDGLRSQWLQERFDDAQDVADSYGTLVTSYEDIRSNLLSASSGFEDVVEVTLMLSDFSKTVGGIVDAYEDAKFERSVANVLTLKYRNSNETTSSPLSTELNSFIEVMLQYP